MCDGRRRQIESPLCAPIQLQRQTTDCNLAPFSIDDRTTHFDLLRCIAIIDNSTAHARGRTLGRNLWRFDIHARPAMIENREVDGVGSNEPHISVDTTVKVEIGFERRNVWIVAVVDADNESVLILCAEAYGIAYVERESRVTADMRPDPPAIDEDLGYLVRAFEVKKDSFTAQAFIE